MEKSCFKGRFCSKAGFNKGCHSQFCRAQHLGIFRILSSYVKKGNALCDNDTYVEDPRLRASGMTALCNGAFTLIELLVVVLIIGILAAVAIPQYQKAVIKSRVFAYMPFVKSLVQAQEAYYLANGQYARFFEDLDVDLASCQLLWEGSSYPYRNMAHCGDSILIDNSIASSVSNGFFELQYCPKNATSYDKCVSAPQRISLVAYFQHSANTERAGKWYCGANYSLGKKICESFNAQYQ